MLVDYVDAFNKQKALVGASSGHCEGSSCSGACVPGGQDVGECGVWCGPTRQKGEGQKQVESLMIQKFSFC